jgi:hypothetical protein
LAYSGYFHQLPYDNLKEIIDLDEPESTPVKERHVIRQKVEELSFDEDHFM